MKITDKTQLFITALKSGEHCTIALTEPTADGFYNRSYACTIDAFDNITFPNDLTDRIQKLCVAVCLCLKYPNTREGDSLAASKMPPAAPSRGAVGDG